MQTQIVWNKDGIKNILSAAQLNPEGQLGSVPYRKLVFKMLWRMYERQTTDEQNADMTKHVNNIGFNGRDANFLSSVAKRALPYQSLTVGQVVYVAKSLKKYAGQLEAIAKERMN